MRSRSVVLVVAIATILATAAPALGREPDANDIELGGPERVERSEWGSYIVLLKSDPLVVTEGRDNLRTQRARNRAGQLRAEQNRVLRQAGVGLQNKVSEYVYVLNGFSAHISHRQAERLAAHRDVALVLPDELYQPTTDSSSDFLGLTGPGGAHRTGNVTGRGVVVGIIDTGIWPEHPSFSPRGIPTPPIPRLQDIVIDGPAGDYHIPACDFGNSTHNPDDAAFRCNNKLVGARQVLPNYRQLIGAEAFEFDSARDDDGHGTHTASTAAGNSGIEASIFGNSFGQITGVAPRAHLIAYKGLGALGGFSSDLALAIDIAVFDGVDVINYSIGGGGITISADELAFLFAADAGVHVATSAGNSGPGPATIFNPGKVPWLTTVGASTQARFLQGTIELGDGATYIGSSITPATGGSYPLLDAEAAGDDLCRLNRLDPETVEGAIVLCRRGAPARLMASAEVQRAGGVGMILYNNSDVDNLFTDNFHVPTVMIDNTPGLAIKAYIASAGAEATAELRDTAVKGTWEPAPSMAVFSSRGPNVFPDVLKPDITAPGFQILAGNSAMPGPLLVPGGPVPRVQGELFQAISGTSMSSPHVAGLYALLEQVNPDWTPAMARSALMTTAHQDVRDNDRVSPADPFDFGAGHADVGGPNQRGSAYQPGLVYDAGFFEYLGFLCDAFPAIFANPAATCGFLESIGVPVTASNLNYPSIAVSELAGVATVTRTVTSVARDGAPRRYTASIDAPDGYSVTVSPSSFTLRRGQTQTFEVTITNQSAPTGEWRFGSLTWESGPYSVRSPIAVNAAALTAPAEVVVSGTEGSSSFDITFGYSGPYSAAAHGFAADTGESGSVAQDPDQTCACDGTGGPGEVPHTFSLSDSAHLRITMTADDLPGAHPDTDIDLFLFRNGSLVAESTAPGTDELIEIPFPEDGNYTLWVHGWQVPDGVVEYTFHLWDVPAATGGTLEIDSAPTQAVLGETATIEFSWSGLSAGQTYLGGISHDTGGLSPLFLTLVRAEN